MGNPVYDQPTTLNESCTCVEAEHRHGTYACYVIDHCTCDECRAANSRYEKHRTKWLGEFPRIPPPLVPPTRTRTHIRRLMRQGMGYKQVADVADVPRSVVGAILWGRSDRKTKMIRRETETAILAVQLELSPGACVPTGEAVTIVDELVARGWTRAAIARRITGRPSTASLQICRHATLTVRALGILRQLLYEPVPARRHSGRSDQPKSDHTWVEIQFVTPGVPIPDAVADGQRIGMRLKLTCEICREPLANHSISQPCRGRRAG